MNDPGDAYKVLQVDPEAEDEVIAAAYRRLARKYHPDITPGPDAMVRMAALNAAWERIGEPTRRAEYDRERAARARVEPTPQAQSARVSTADRPRMPEPEQVSRDWSSGRSSVGGGYDPSMGRAQGDGAAGPPPGNPSGSVLNFGRYAGWSLGELGRTDLEYIEWLDRMPIGRPYRDEIDAILRRAGRRRSAEADSTERRGLFRRR